MSRFFVLLAVAVVVAAIPTLAERSAAGQWRVEFATPLGQRGASLTVVQNGAGLSGHVVDEYGEYDMRGRVEGTEVTMSWAVPENGRMLAIAMRGTLDGDAIRGTVRLGEVGEGPFSARRTGDAGDR